MACWPYSYTCIAHEPTDRIAALEAKSVGDNGEMEDLDSTPNNYYSLWMISVKNGLSSCRISSYFAVKANADLYKALLVSV